MANNFSGSKRGFATDSHTIGIGLSGSEMPGNCGRNGVGTSRFRQSTDSRLTSLYLVKKLVSIYLSYRLVIRTVPRNPPQAVLNTNCQIECGRWRFRALHQVVRSQVICRALSHILTVAESVKSFSRPVSTAHPVRSHRCCAQVSSDGQEDGGQCFLSVKERDLQKHQEDSGSKEIGIDSVCQSFSVRPRSA